MKPLIINWQYFGKKSFSTRVIIRTFQPSKFSDTSVKVAEYFDIETLINNRKQNQNLQESRKKFYQTYKAFETHE